MRESSVRLLMLASVLSRFMGKPPPGNHTLNRA